MALPKLDLPRHKTALPSSGQEVIMRPYLVKEEKLLLLALESQDPEQIALAIKTLIENCIETELDMENLAGFDIEKLFLELRGISVGETIALNAKCQSCEHQNEVSLDIKDVKMTDYNPEDRIIKLTESVGVTMNYPTATILSKIDPEKLETIEGIMDLIIACVNNIFDDENVYEAKDDNEEEIKSFIEGLTTEQFKKVGQFFRAMPMLAYDMEFTCEKCQFENKVELRGLQSFFT